MNSHDVLEINTPCRWCR